MAIRVAGSLVALVLLAGCGGEDEGQAYQRALQEEAHGDPFHAKNVWASFLASHPEGEHAAEARERLADHRAFDEIRGHLRGESEEVPLDGVLGMVEVYLAARPEGIWAGEVRETAAWTRAVVEFRRGFWERVSSSRPTLRDAQALLCLEAQGELTNGKVNARFDSLRRSTDVFLKIEDEAWTPFAGRTGRIATRGPSRKSLEFELGRQVVDRRTYEWLGREMTAARERVEARVRIVEEGRTLWEAPFAASDPALTASEVFQDGAWCGHGAAEREIRDLAAAAASQALPGPFAGLDLEPEPREGAFVYALASLLTETRRGTEEALEVLMGTAALPEGSLREEAGRLLGR